MEGHGRTIHEHVTGNAAADSGDSAEHHRGYDAQAGREAFRGADDGPQGYRDVVKQIDDGVEVSGQFAEVEHHHARDGAGQQEPRALEGVQAVLAVALQQHVADDAAAHTGDAGDGHGAEDVVAGAHGGHTAGQAAGDGGGELEPEGEREGGIEGFNHGLGLGFRLRCG